MKKSVFIFSFSILFTSILLADTATYMPGAWGMLTPFKSYDIEMPSEKIDIDVYLGFFSFDPSDSAFSIPYFYTEYRCSYNLKNTGKDTDLMLGFPLKYGSFARSAAPFFGDCTIKVNGEQTPYNKYIHGINDELKEIDYNEVFGFKASFKNDEEKTIDVFYTDLVLIEYGVEREHEMNYILKSARALKGSIGKADLSVKFHFPAKVKVLWSPGEEKQKYQDADPYCMYLWNLKNIIPANDIELSFEPSVLPNPGSDIFNYKSCLDRLGKGKSLIAYFELLKMIAEPMRDFVKKKKSWKEIGYDKLLVDAALKNFYSHTLKDSEISNIFAGFIIGDIDSWPIRNPDKALVESIRKILDSYAQKEYERELAKIKNIRVFLSKDTIRADEFDRINTVLNSGAPLLPFMYTEQANIQAGNYYYKRLESLFDKKEFSDLLIGAKNMLAKAREKTLTYLFSQPDDNCSEIADLAHGFETNDFVSETNKIWDTKTDPAKTRKLSKMLRALHTYAPFDRRNDLIEISPKLLYTNYELLFQDRTVMRKAYYALGNNSFRYNEFENAIKYYRTGIAYGNVSPLCNFYVGSANMWGTMIYWYEGDGSDLYKDPNSKYDWPAHYRATKLIMNSQKPFWKDLPNPKAPTEEDIANLYTPERLLKLNLEKWEQEKADEAPCYYFAYNTACAYSRLEKGKEALGWLEVAIGMNRSLAKTIAGDNDLKFVRENYKSEVEKLIKQ